MLQGKTSFYERLSSQIRHDWGAFSAEMMSCAMHYDVIYYPFPINSQYLNTLEVESPGSP